MRTRRAVPMMPTRWVLASDEDICLCRKACSFCPKCRWLPVMAPSVLPLAHTTSSLNSSKTCMVNMPMRYLHHGLEGRCSC